MSNFRYQFTAKTELNRLIRLVDYLWKEGYLLDANEAARLNTRFKALEMRVPDSVVAALPGIPRRGRPQKRLSLAQYIELLDAKEFKITKLKAGVKYEAAMLELSKKFRYGGQYAGVKHWEDALARYNRDAE